MDEAGENGLPLEKLVRNPIGEVILGPTDPRLLTKEEFYSSPKLLFHGSEKEFEFDQSYKYQGDQNSHSTTVGAGLYTTPKREDAILFSRKWGAKEGEEVVTSLLPHEARMFDFRDRDNIFQNAPVPVDMFTKYREFLRKYIENRFPQRPEGYNFYYNNLQIYLHTLYDLRNQGNSVDLRQMLSLMGDGRASEFASYIFPAFMKEEGYDGAIYIEGGDHKDHKNPVSFIFYNLKKVGTFDSWHQEANHNS